MQLTSIHLSVFPPFTLAPRSTGTGLSIAGILGIVSAVVAAFVLLVLGMVVCIKFHGPFRRNTPVVTQVPPKSQELEPSTHSHKSGLQQQHTATFVNSQGTLGNFLHSMVPLESELQNVPPPAYSAAYQYPVYIPDRGKYEMKDDLSVQNDNTSLSKEFPQEYPPPYPASASMK